MAIDLGDLTYTVRADTAALLTGSRGVVNSTNAMQRGFDNADRSSNKLNKSMGSLSRVAGALSAALSVGAITKYSDSWVEASNKINTVIGVHGDLAITMGKVFEIANATQTSMSATTTLYTRLAKAAEALGTSEEDLLTVTKAINQSMSLSGATSSETESSITQLTQGLNRGVLAGQEFNTVIKSAPRIMQALIDYTGKSASELKKMGSDGTLTSQLIIDAMKAAADSIDSEFSKAIVTASQHLTVASNNIQKFIGESTVVRETIAGAGKAISSITGNMALMSGAFIAAAAVIGGKYLNSMGRSISETVKSTKSISDSRTAALAAAQATNAKAVIDLKSAAAATAKAGADHTASLASADRAKADLLSLSAVYEKGQADVVALQATVRKAAADKLAADSAYQAAVANEIGAKTNAEYTAAKLAQTNAITAGTVATNGLKSAELQLIAIEEMRAKQLATLAGLESSVVVAEEARALAERQLAIATASQSIANEAATATTARLTIAQKAATMAARALATATALASKALALIGGPGGLLILAAAGAYYLYQGMDDGKIKALEYADSLDSVSDSLGKLTKAQLVWEQSKASDSIAAQTEELEKLDKAIKANNRTLEVRRNFLEKGARSDSTRAQAQSQINNLMKEGKRLASEYDTTQQKLNRSTSVLSQITDTLATKFGGLAQEIRKVGATPEAISKVTDALARMSADLKIAQLEQQGLTAEAAGFAAILPIATAAGAEYASQVDWIAQNLDAASQSADPFIAKLAALFKLAGQVANVRKESKEPKSTSTKTDQDADAIKGLSEQMEVAKLEAQGLAREAAALSAVQSLSANATKEQKDQVKALAEATFDLRQKQEDYNASLTATPELQENKNYTDSASRLKRQLDGDIINQQAYNQQSETLEAEHQANLAKIRADQAVTPQMEAAGMVDPVQALANENARKLALIQEFEANKTLTEQQAMALRNAQATTYEQARIDAAWEIWSNQNETNQLLSGMLDAVGQRTTNMVTGLLTGTQSISEAMSNLAATVLEQAVGALVEMGLAQVKNAIIAQTTSAETASAQIAAISSVEAAERAKAAVNGALYAASVTAQVSTMSALAAQAAFASTAAIPIIGPALAPASAAAAGMAAAAIGSPAIATASLAGARRYGGGVSAGNMYRYNEGGQPEVYQDTSGRQFMMPTKSGKVIPADEVGGGGGWSIIVNNMASGVDIKPSVNNDERVITIAVNRAVNAVAGQLASQTGNVAQGLRSGWQVSGKTQ